MTRGDKIKIEFFEFPFRISTAILPIVTLHNHDSKICRKKDRMFSTAEGVEK